VILGDLDRELAAWIAAGVADGSLPPAAARIAPGRTWRRAPDQNPASFATSIAFELAAATGRPPARFAASLARPLRRLSWVAAAEPARDGYLTITVTSRALGHAAARLAVGGPSVAVSTTLAGTTTTASPWPDPATAPSWRHAWQDHAAVMTSRLAQAAGARVTARTKISGERGKPGAGAAATAQPSSGGSGPARSALAPADAVSPRDVAVADAVAWFGVSAVRYGLARTSPGRVAELGRVLLRPGASGPDPLYPVRQAHASAESTLRWAADLHVQPGDPADLLGSPAEQALLGLLPWLPVRVAAAAARGRPDELPFFLEAVSDAWLAVRMAAPPLPFGGGAAPADPAVAGARLTLAGAVRVVLACGLTLTGAGPCESCWPAGSP
jgi:arginyl-tRNA synthetase